MSRFLGFAGSRALLRETPGGAPTPSEAVRSLSARDVAELALEAPDTEVRAAMWWLLHGERRPGGLVAQELLAVAEAQPERVPAAALDAARAAIARGPGRSARSVVAAAAAAVWTLVLLLVALCLRGRRPVHGGRAVAVALLVAALFVAQVDVTVAGWPLLPAWAGWGLAAVAVSWVGSATADTEARRAAMAFVVAAVASVAVYVAGTAAEIVAALAAVAGCVALAPLAPALLRDLVPEGPSSLPRKSASATGWRLGARIALPAGLAAGAVAGATMLTPHQIAAAALFYVALAACFGGVLLWRLSLARGTAQALPVPFAVGLVVPALALLVTESVTRLVDGPDRELPEPLGPAARVWICCALLFALVRLWDAARVRCRADRAAAARPRQRAP